MDDMRQESIKMWNGDRTLESINAGSLQRIADACEKMALRYTELIMQRDMYLRWYNKESDRVLTLKRQLAAAKGQITKLKRSRP